MKSTTILRTVGCKLTGMDIMTIGSHQPFLLHPSTSDWTRDVIETEGGAGFSAVKALVNALPRKVRVLVLYGSLRERFVMLIPATEMLANWLPCRACAADHIHD